MSRVVCRHCLRYWTDQLRRDAVSPGCGLVGPRRHRRPRARRQVPARDPWSRSHHEVAAVDRHALDRIALDVDRGARRVDRPHPGAAVEARVSTLRSSADSRARTRRRRGRAARSRRGSPASTARGSSRRSPTAPRAVAGELHGVDRIAVAAQLAGGARFREIDHDDLGRCPPIASVRPSGDQPPWRACRCRRTSSCASAGERSDHSVVPS